MPRKFSWSRFFVIVSISAVVAFFAGYSAARRFGLSTAYSILLGLIVPALYLVSMTLIARQQYRNERAQADKDGT